MALHPNEKQRRRREAARRRLYRQREKRILALCDDLRAGNTSAALLRIIRQAADAPGDDKQDAERLCELAREIGELAKSDQVAPSYRLSLAVALVHALTVADYSPHP